MGRANRKSSLSKILNEVLDEEDHIEMDSYLLADPDHIDDTNIEILASDPEYLEIACDADDMRVSSRLLDEAIDNLEKAGNQLLEDIQKLGEDYGDRNS